MTFLAPIRIASLATAVPTHILERDFVQAEAKRIFARFGDEFERMAGVFANTGIDRRYSVCPVEWFETATSWGDRAARFLEGAKTLFRQAATEALDKAQVLAKDIDVIVTVSPGAALRRGRRPRRRGSGPRAMCRPLPRAS